MNKIVSRKESSLVQPDRLPIALRAYATPPLPPDDEGPKKKRQGEPALASEWTLIFDTETTVDAAQRLRSAPVPHEVPLSVPQGSGSCPPLAAVDLP
jgi:hypothetical protein